MKEKGWFVRASVPFTVVIAVLAVLATAFLNRDDLDDIPFDEEVSDSERDNDPFAEPDTAPDGEDSEASRDEASGAESDRRPVTGSVRSYELFGDFVPSETFSGEHSDFAEFATEFTELFYSRDASVQTEAKMEELTNYASKEFILEMEPWLNNPEADEELRETGEVVEAHTLFQPQHVYLYFRAVRARGVVNVTVLDQEGVETGFYVFGVEVFASDDGQGWLIDRIEYAELE